MFRLTLALACLTLKKAAPQTNRVPRLDGRIVGGEPAFIEDHPYQASLQYQSSHRCGAVIISEGYAVTAAHCTDRIPASNLALRVGSTFRNTGGIVVQIAQTFQHPMYNDRNVDYDITVLHLASELSFGSAVSPVSLPEPDQPVEAGSIGRVSGWGSVSEGGSLPNQLQVVEVPVVSLQQCRAAYGASSVTDRMVCAGVPEGGKDACQGDSGGPLVVNGTLIGLVSWGLGCARPDYPGVYASVPALRSYISEVSGL